MLHILHLHLHLRLRSVTHPPLEHFIIPVISLGKGDKVRHTLSICRQFNNQATSNVVTRLLDHIEEENIRQKQLIPHHQIESISDQSLIRQVHTESLLHYANSLQNVSYTQPISIFIQAQFSNRLPLVRPLTLEFQTYTKNTPQQPQGPSHQNIP